ncbi:hypothetical protein GCM10009662_08860 [Catellatospora coxensis]|uniref:Uncharacterized protein n=1 Tax=Catellatospora coxensis TaxID=310354 RepID=A0A8J3KSH3_9ACTN|nr:hypothetical protein Cco03nite_30200 [Catellatospora coxensis]
MVQATNRMIPGCYAGVRVTVEVERAAERGVTVADGFVQAPERFQDWLTPEWVDELTGAAIEGVHRTLDRQAEQTGPLRVVLVKHMIHPTDTHQGSVLEAAARAVKVGIDLLGEQAAEGEPAPVSVRHRNTAMRGSCFAGARVTVDLTRAAERSLTIADDFIQVADDMRDYLDDREWLAELVEGARRGALNALDEYGYRVGPLRAVLVEHKIHPVDSGYLAVKAAAHRAVKEAIDLLGPAMVRDWVTITPTGPVVRLTSPPDTVFPEGSGVVTIEAEPAAERAVLVAGGFVLAGDAERVDTAEVERLAVAAANESLDLYEKRVGPLRLTLLSHPYGVQWSDRYGLETALRKAVRMAVEQLEFALATARQAQSSPASRRRCSNVSSGIDSPSRAPRPTISGGSAGGTSAPSRRARSDAGTPST